MHGVGRVKMWKKGTCTDCIYNQLTEIKKFQGNSPLHDPSIVRTEFRIQRNSEKVPI